MHEFWTIHIVNMMYNTSQNYTNMMVGEHGIQTFEVVIVVVIWCFCPYKCTSPITFGQMVCPNVLKYKIKSQIGCLNIIEHEYACLREKNTSYGKNI